MTNSIRTSIAAVRGQSDNHDEFGVATAAPNSTNLIFEGRWTARMSGPSKKHWGKPRHIQKREESERAAWERQKHQEHLVAINAVASQLAADQNAQDAGDDERARREKISIGLLIATVIFTAVADVIFFQTMEDARGNSDKQVAEMKGQLAEMKKASDIARAQQRPWLEVNLESAGDFAFADGGRLGASVQIKLHNAGTLPAIVPQIALGMTTVGDEFTPLPKEVQDGACSLAESGKAMKKIGGFAFGLVKTPWPVFPGRDADTRKTSFHADLDDRYVRDTKLIGPPPAKVVRVALTGCVAYQAPSDGTWHHTRFEYSIWKKAPNGVGNLMIGPGEKVIRSDDMRFEQEDAAGNSAD